MNPVRSIKNQYPGINAHLHSYWQAVGGWNNFHNPHIAQLMSALRLHLLPMGYTVSIEESLQIRRDNEYTRHPKSDITIYDLLPGRQPPPAASSESLTGLVLPLPAVLEDNAVSEKPYRSAVIYKRDDRHQREPVTWIELLSPSNKRPGSDNTEYIRKRHDVLESGIVFVEIDYLHETPPTLARVPDYSAGNGHQAPTHPYRIIVLDPRPEIDIGQASINEFDVDVPIPTVSISLSGAERLLFDVNVPYQKQYSEMVYGWESVDYSQLPLNFERYSVTDQQRIAARMLAVLEAARAGIDLETAALTVKNLPLDEALKQIETLVKG